MAKGRAFYDLLKYSSLGLEMGAAVVIGLLIGMFLDRKLGTDPWLTLLFMILGFVAAGRALIKAVRGSVFEEEEEAKD